MADNTKIEWTDATWNPVTGCSVVSPGCTNCYAMRFAGTRLRNHPSRAGLTQDSKKGPVWTGEVRFNEEWLDQPLRWKRPRRIFVVAHGDLFHEGVPFEWIDKVFAVMALSPQHIFQVLTKRPERMREYMGDCERRVAQLVVAAGRKYGWQTRHDTNGETVGFDGPCWPLPNVWLGTSVEDQARADERVPHLLDTPAAVRWVSYEPALGEVDFSRMGLWLCEHWKSENALPRAPWRPEDPSKWWWERQRLRGSGQIMLDWIVVGGESGPNARAFNIGWARNTVDQCRAAGVPIFIKQLGARPVDGKFRESDDVTPWPLRLKDRKGGDIGEWPKNLCVREYPVDA